MLELSRKMETDRYKISGDVTFTRVILGHGEFRHNFLGVCRIGPWKVLSFLHARFVVKSSMVVKRMFEFLIPKLFTILTCTVCFLGIPT